MAMTRMKQGIMRCALLCAALCCLALLCAAPAMADGWFCPSCGRTNTETRCANCGKSRPAGADTLKVTGYLAVYSRSTEQYVRRSDGRLSGLGRDEYVAFSLDLTNQGKGEHWFRDVHFRVDGGEPLRLMDFSLQGNRQTKCHVYHTNMDRMAPGTHKVEFYVNGMLVNTDHFHLIRDWQSIMPYPGSAQIAAVSGKGRSPYVVFYPQFGAVQGLTEFALDFWIDDMDDYTYFAAMDWEMDVSSLKQKYASVTNDYNDPGGVYCGFQRWENGRTGVIMSVWDVFCKDRSGRTKVYCARELYPEVREGVSKTSGEGSFQQFIQEYHWEARHPYRMLMQQSTSEDTGNTVLTMWVCDLVSMRWDRLVSFDLGYASAYMHTKSMAGFMENYGTSHAGQVRNVSIANVRGRNYRTGQWVAARDMVFTVNNSITMMDYIGSYSFGADDHSFWIITSGVSGLCRLPKSGSRYSVKYASTDSPY